MPDYPTTVIVLMGGPDAERPVSISSGREVAQALRSVGEYQVIEHVIDTPDADELAAAGADVLFPVLHGKWGEGGPLQRELERTGIAYVGSGPRSSALCMNKLRTKIELADIGVPSPPSQLIRTGEKCEIEPPLVLKPVDDGSSVDLRICRTHAEVQAGRTILHETRPELLAERYIAGREVTVAVVLGEALPIIEIVPAEGVYDYEAKYSRDDTRYIIDPELPETLAQSLLKWSVQAYHHLGCRHLCRLDFMVDERGAWFLEANTMPGFTSHSLVPKAAAATGIPMPELCRQLVEAALHEESAARREILPTHSANTIDPAS